MLPVIKSNAGPLLVIDFALAKEAPMVNPAAAVSSAASP